MCERRAGDHATCNIETAALGLVAKRLVSRLSEALQMGLYAIALISTLTLNMNFAANTQRTGGSAPK
jgi:hypothetical protein